MNRYDMMHNSRSRDENSGPARIQTSSRGSEGVTRKGLFTLVSPDGMVFRIPPENVCMEMEDYGAAYRVSIKIPYPQVRDMQKVFNRTF